MKAFIKYTFPSSLRQTIFSGNTHPYKTISFLFLKFVQIIFSVKWEKLQKLTYPNLFPQKLNTTTTTFTTTINTYATTVTITTLTTSTITATVEFEKSNLEMENFNKTQHITCIYVIC